MTAGLDLSRTSALAERRYSGQVGVITQTLNPWHHLEDCMYENAVEILLVEDNPGDVELTLIALRKNKIANTIHVARDGEEALDFLLCRGQFENRNFLPPPKLILLDLKLPKVDGLEVLRQIKEDPSTKAIPVVMMTTSNQEEDMVKSYHYGVNSYIQKPVDFDNFCATVRQVGLYWLLVNEPPPKEAFVAAFK